MLADKIGESEGQMVGVRVLETSAAAAQNDTEITTSSTKEPSGNRQGDDVGLIGAAAVVGGWLRLGGLLGGLV